MMRAQGEGEDATMTRPIHSVFFAHSVHEKSLSISLVCCMSPSTRSTWKCLEIFRESKLLTSPIPRSTHGMVWSLSGPLELLYVMRMLHLHRKPCSSQSLKCQLGRLKTAKALKSGHHAPSHSVKFSSGNHGVTFNFVKQRAQLCMMQILAPLEILAWLISVHQTRNEPWRSIQPAKRVEGKFSCASCQGWQWENMFQKMMPTKLLQFYEKNPQRFKGCRGVCYCFTIVWLHIRWEYYPLHVVGYCICPRCL